MSEIIDEYNINIDKTAVPTEKSPEQALEQSTESGLSPVKKSEEKAFEDDLTKDPDPIVPSKEKKILKTEEKIAEIKSAKTKHSTKNSFRFLLLGILIGIFSLLLVELFVLNPWGNGINLLDLLIKSRVIETLVDDNYLYDADKYYMQENMYLGMIYGLTEDDYAAYYTEESYTQQQRTTQGSYVGIGVNITEDTEERGILVVSVNEDGPAFEAGIEAGDIITAVDGESLAGVDSSDAVEMISGEEGTFVDLSILRENETLNLNVERRTVITISVHTEVLTEDITGRRKVKGADIGYISINTFNMETRNEFTEALDILQSENEVAGLIIDLRNNSGGELTTCLAMMDRILKDNLTPVRSSSSKEDKNMTDTDPSKNTLLLQIENKEDIDQVYRAEDGDSVSLPIVILVNGNSASASEVFAGTLRDYGYKIIGNKTFGKGIVQTTYSLYDNTAVKFTTHQYRLAGGDLIHGKGIEPDIEVDFEPYDYVTEETLNYANGAAQPDIMKDKQIAAAVSEMDEQIYEAFQDQ